MSTHLCSRVQQKSYRVVGKFGGGKLGIFGLRQAFDKKGLPKRLLIVSTSLDGFSLVTMDD